LDKLYAIYMRTAIVYANIKTGSGSHGVWERQQLKMDAVILESAHARSCAPCLGVGISIIIIAVRDQLLHHALFRVISYLLNALHLSAAFRLRIGRALGSALGRSRGQKL
jgi:hypothetical protein